VLCVLLWRLMQIDCSGLYEISSSSSSSAVCALLQPW
jgi:hypothetical protein